MWGLHDDGMDFVGDAFHSNKDALVADGLVIEDVDTLRYVPGVLVEQDMHQRLAEVSRPVRALIDFVALAKRREAETGEPVWIERGD